MSVTVVPVEMKRAAWSPGKRLAFRWVFLFLAMLLIPALIRLFVRDGGAFQAEAQFWQTVVPWVSKHVFGITREIRNFGSGDTAFANLRLLQQALLAAVGAGIWSAVHRNGLEYERLNYWLRVATRCLLADMLLSYGIAKVFHVQFPYPPLTTLIQPFGELNPHGLHWSFMGYSRAYQIFAGGLECGAAVLLFWNRTTTLGALLSGAVLANILVLDWAYGTPVKLIVVRMLLFTGFLLLKDASRLAKVLLWNAPTEAVDETTPWRDRRWKWVVYAGWAAVVVWIIGWQVRWAMRLHPTVDDRGRPALYGVYKVQRQSLSGREIAADAPERWGLTAFDNMDRNESHLVVRRVDESWQRYVVKYDASNTRMTIGRDQELRITRPDSDTVRLEGSLDAKSIDVTLGRLPNPEFPLEKNTGLYWIRRW